MEDFTILPLLTSLNESASSLIKHPRNGRITVGISSSRKISFDSALTINGHLILYKDIVGRDLMCWMVDLLTLCWSLNERFSSQDLRSMAWMMMDMWLEIQRLRWLSAIMTSYSLMCSIEARYQSSLRSKETSLSSLENLSWSNILLNSSWRMCIKIKKQSWCSTCLMRNKKWKWIW